MSDREKKFLAAVPGILKSGASYPWRPPRGISDYAIPLKLANSEDAPDSPTKYSDGAASRNIILHTSLRASENCLPSA
jgi:hypothetical protein